MMQSLYKPNLWSSAFSNWNPILMLKFKSVNKRPRNLADRVLTVLNYIGFMDEKADQFWGSLTEVEAFSTIDWGYSKDQGLIIEFETNYSNKSSLWWSFV